MEIKEQQKQIDDLATKMIANMSYQFRTSKEDEDEEREIPNIIDLEPYLNGTSDLTDVGEAFVKATCTVFNRIAGQSSDIFVALGLMNRLAVQNIMRNTKIDCQKK